MKLIYVNNERMQSFLEENGIYPIKYRGFAAVYVNSEKLQSQLDEYYIKYVICKSIY